MISSTCVLRAILFERWCLRARSDFSLCTFALLIVVVAMPRWKSAILKHQVVKENFFYKNAIKDTVSVLYCLKVWKFESLKVWKFECLRMHLLQLRLHLPSFNTQPSTSESQPTPALKCPANWKLWKCYRSTHRKTTRRSTQYACAITSRQSKQHSQVNEVISSTPCSTALRVSSHRVQAGIHCWLCVA